MRARWPTVLGLCGGLLVLASLLRYRHENDDAGGFAAVRDGTSIDFYAGGTPDHKMSIVLLLAGCIAAIGAVLIRHRAR